MLSQKSIESAAQRFVAAAHSLIKVILFGSYATGKARENSDIDLLVVEDDIPAMAAEYSRICSAIGFNGIGVDILLYPKAECERRIDWQTSRVFDAVRYGKVLYERVT